MELTRFYTNAPTGGTKAYVEYGNGEDVFLRLKVDAHTVWNAPETLELDLSAFHFTELNEVGALVNPAVPVEASTTAANQVTNQVPGDKTENPFTAPEVSTTPDASTADTTTTEPVPSNTVDPTTAESSTDSANTTEVSNAGNSTE